MAAEERYEEMAEVIAELRRSITELRRPPSPPNRNGAWLPVLVAAMATGIITTLTMLTQIGAFVTRYSPWIQDKPHIERQLATIDVQGKAIQTLNVERAREAEVIDQFRRTLEACCAIERRPEPTPRR